MSNKEQFSIRLANGREQTFSTAAEMAQWVSDQHEMSRPRRKKGTQRSRQKPKQKVRCYSGNAPLARYANRNSDET